MRMQRAILASLLLATSTQVLAENPSPMPEWMYSAGIPLTRRFMDEIPKWQVVLGLSAEVLPKYDGASRYHVLGGPMFDIRYKDLAFLATGEGLGVNFFANNYVRTGFAITYDLGRSRSLSHELNRLSDINPTPEAKLFGEVVLFPLVIRADIRRSMGGYNGWAGDVSAYMPVAGWKRRLFVFAGPSVMFGDRNYMTRYFGITRAESQASGLREFSPGGGAKAVSFGADASWLMGHHWFLNLALAGACLIDDANRSPTTRNQVQGLAGFTVAYRF